ncbi:MULTISPECIES: hypothetical protein [Vibrio]|uniref:hypothetical protein n=1 Tax=Vibrio TaxID=662 RepID=UPI001594D330|nr:MULTISPECIES: hypothetical protein [Vibrio]MDF9401589.1 hypothetical protein [Vibrio sp. 1180_3]NGZ19404.1 hypothetical protein [Vibrio aestuarianus]
MELKEGVTLFAALIAAVASVTAVWLNAHYATKKHRLNKLWEKEHERIFQLEETIGVFVDNLILFRIRSEEEKEDYYKAQRYLENAMGRFRRYEELRESLRLLSHDASWYFSNDMKHKDNSEFETAKNNLLQSFKKFTEECDRIQGR